MTHWFFGILAEAFSLSSVPQYLRFYSRVDILSARWKALSVCLLVTKCTYNCQNHRVIKMITRWISMITLPTFCRLVLPPKIKTSKWGLDIHWASPQNEDLKIAVCLQNLKMRFWFGFKASKWGLDMQAGISWANRQNVGVVSPENALYHLSEITILHEIAQRALFSRLFACFRTVCTEGWKRKL